LPETLYSCLSRNMDADTSLGPGPPFRRGNLPGVGPDPDYRPGRPAPSVWRDRTERALTRKRAIGLSETDSSSLTASFPLFFFGAVCAVLAVYVRLEEPGAVVGRIPLWVPLLAFGIIGLVGGTLSVFAKPDDSAEPVRPDPPPERPRVPKARYSPDDRPIRGIAPAGPPAARPPPRRAPDSMAEPIRPRPTRPISAPRRAEPPPAADADSTSPPDVPASDLSSLLSEIDSIEADLNSSHLPSSATGAGLGAAVRPPALIPNSVPISRPSPAARGPETPTAGPSAPDHRRSEPPRRPLLCVGCSSPILDPGPPIRCQSCREPICAACRDRALAEGKPGLCPFCSLLDEVDAKEPPPRAGEQN
jgi:hypothetical protein